MSNNWTEALDIFDERYESLVAIPLLMLRGLSLDDAIKHRHKAVVTIWECTDDSLELYMGKHNRVNKRFRATDIHTRLERRGFYDPKYLFCGFELTNPWDFVRLNK
ncbi:hypothetical protein [Vibrio mediterranei]|uniref:hypothetical protein n=1 Tax=Vibrio mediterranei TaxID=689 RepID=UPI00406955E9